MIYHWHIYLKGRHTNLNLSGRIDTTEEIINRFKSQQLTKVYEGEKYCEWDITTSDVNFYKEDEKCPHCVGEYWDIIQEFYDAN